MATEISTRKDPLDVPDLTRRAIDLDVTLLGDGSVLRVPINIVAGKGDHPCLVAVAGIHGDEYDGIHALLELWDELEATDLVGRLVMVPSANPPAVAASRRCSPLDNIDLNRIFPGKASGLPSEQTAHYLFESVVKHADFVFSMHGWTAYGAVVPYVEFNHGEASTARVSFDAAAAAGFKIIRVSNWPAGLMTRVANEAGIPGIEAEIGGMGITTAENRKLYKCYLRRLMAHLGMSEMRADHRVPPATPRIVEHFDITSPIGGAMYLETQIDTEVRGGQKLATIKDFHCRVLHEVIAPRPGLVGMARVCGLVQPGELMFRIFRDVPNPLG
jgi:predicted deacylase